MIAIKVLLAVLDEAAMTTLAPGTRQPGIDPRTRDDESCANVVWDFMIRLQLRLDEIDCGLVGLVLSRG